MMLKARMLTYCLTALAAIGLAACGADREAAADGPARVDDALVGPDREVEALANPNRLDEDWADDEMRKPAEVLRFAAVKPGMTVFEMEAGRGYYTELLAYLVGPDGEVVMQSPEEFGFLREAIEARLADNRLPNVRLSQTLFDDLDAEDGSVDMVTWFLGPHELYFAPTGVDTLGDVDKAYGEIHRILKSGGTFVILDHAAAPGAPNTTGGTIHRIDPAIVKGLAEDAGFEFVAESNILRNSDDDHTMSVFDPAIRRQTDRFLLKYRKPE